MNLCINSIKFTHHGHIEIQCRYNADKKLLYIAVKDTGIGIAKDKIGRLFKAFSQADASTTRRFGGTGLGLHISQKLANLIGGEITVESVEGIGSRFELQIDVSQSPNIELINVSENSAVQTTNYSSPSHFPKLQGHILLAEDVVDNQRLISYYINKTGAEVTVVDNGQLAIEAAEFYQYDLILMDMQMPVMGGMEAIKILRDSGCKTPIYALTANAMKEDIEKYISIGCDGFLSKPIEQTNFYHTLSQNLDTSNKKRQLPATSYVNTDFYKQLIKEFINSLPGYLAQLNTAICESNYMEIAEIAHALKGMGGSFGYHDLTERAAELNEYIKSNNQRAAINHTKVVSQLLETIISDNAGKT